MPKSESLPVIPLRDVVVLPGARVPFVAGRPASLQAERAALAVDSRVFLVKQRDGEIREPAPKDLHGVGTVGRIVEHEELADGHLRLLVEGQARASAARFIKQDVHLSVDAEPIRTKSSRARGRAVQELVVNLDEYLSLEAQPQLDELRELPTEHSDLGQLCDALASGLPVDIELRQELLEAVAPSDRLERLRSWLESESERLRLDRQLNRKVESQLERSQREFILREKLKAIRSELGAENAGDELEQLDERIAKAGMPEEAEARAREELLRLESMAPMTAEASVSRTYLDWLVSLPWTQRSETVPDIAGARRILEEDHHGLDRVKERILEHLAVASLRGDGTARGSVLCLVGPPGVGKTSLGRSIARATGREFVRISLGGVRDEAEIRGHRRTYVGAYPGRLIQGLKRAGAKNPVFMLDEVDKLASDFRGDPAASLLEVLDPEQNHGFLDHYLDIEFDLSEVMFCCTANVVDGIPPALLDRLELIRLPGYTAEEKVEIAERFLLPRQLEEHGLSAKQLRLRRPAVQALVSGYTREAGVRGLERRLATACRKVAVRVAEKPRTKLDVKTAAALEDLLGAPEHRQAEAESEPQVGLAQGLSWSATGGQLLVVEAAVLPGEGELLVTGQLGSVMKESLQAAVSHARSRSSELGLPDKLLDGRDVHVHVPEGAIPKDGPSAGITLATAVISALTGRKVRSDLAMTGEITLRGRVLPVGGLKEKLLAARRAGVGTVILPAGCERELEEVPDALRSELELVEVTSMDEVLDLALLPAEKAAS
ncbi:MAG: endopeptidase La [Acidobacteriota bacterium]